MITNRVIGEGKTPFIWLFLRKLLVNVVLKHSELWRIIFTALGRENGFYLASLLYAISNIWQSGASRSSLNLHIEWTFLSFNFITDIDILFTLSCSSLLLQRWIKSISLHTGAMFFLPFTFRYPLIYSIIWANAWI